MVKKIIITGGPGTGKTSLIEELNKEENYLSNLIYKNENNI